MDPLVWDRIQVEARRRIRQREEAQEQRVAALEQARREAQRPQDAPPLGFVAQLIEHLCPECAYKLWIQRELMQQDHDCSGCGYNGLFAAAHPDEV